jgi:allantoate deiminase
MTFAPLQLRAHAEQIVARCRELAAITDVPGETTRTFLSPATRHAQALVTRWMEQAGLAVQIDVIGNLRGLSPAVGPKHAPSRPRLLIGSHLDTVINAGAFDGALGILLALALVALAGELSFAIEIVAFSEEEGVRFRQPFLGSLALTGESVPVTVTDSEGISLAQALEQYGHTPTAPALLSPAVFSYLEFHIEQGPVLEAEGRPLAAVSAIAGQTRLRLRFTGQANHAGTTPMRLRHDALAAAAEWIVAVETCALVVSGLVATVGSIKAVPDLGNVVPGEFAATLDLRHADDAVRHHALKRLTDAAHAASSRRGVTCAIEPVLDQPAVAMDPALTEALVRAAAACGYDATPIASGAGHDAMILARRVPAAMLFLRTPGGLSHHPDEAVLPEDIEAALATGLAFLQSLSRTMDADAQPLP